MLFHVSATMNPATPSSAVAALKITLDEMKAEGVVLSACRCADETGYFFVVEAGDVDEATEEVQRLARAADEDLHLSVTEVRRT